jgi:hypothetical protein
MCCESKQKMKINVNEKNNNRAGGCIISLLDAVYTASSSAENGCKVVSEGEGTVCVYDCGKWGKESTALLIYLRPNAEICVQTSINSLSGFRIIVSEPQAMPSFYKRMLLILLSTLLFALCFCIVHEYVLVHDLFFEVQLHSFFRNWYSVSNVHNGTVEPHNSTLHDQL